MELSSMIQADADVVISHVDALEAYVAGGSVGDPPRLTALARFRHNSYYVRGQALLSDDSPAVANWVLRQSNELYIKATAAWTSHGLTPKITGPVRSIAMEVAQETTAALFAWQLGQKPTRWFEEQLS